MATESLEEYYDSFDEVTLEKLDIYSRYLSEWLPAPLSGRMHVRETGIYALYCGSDYAANGSAGSPMRAVTALRAQARQITEHSDINVRLVFNDADPSRVRNLAGRLGPEVQTDDGRCLAHIQYHSQPFCELLDALLPQIKKSRTANLLFFDQFSEGEHSEARLAELHALKQTDLMIFVTSKWFRRFAESETAQLWAVDESDLASVNYNHIHRFMTSYFRSLLGKEYFVAPFTLKRCSEVYGLVFASHNPFRLERFLKVAWRRDPYSYEPNFDLYEETQSRIQLSLLDAHKVFDFQKELMAYLDSGKFTTDRDIYLYVLQRGFLRRHAADTLRAFCNRRNARFMTRAGKLAGPRLSFTSVRKPRPIVYD